MKKIIGFFTSLRLTVALLAFSLALIFFGTLDQARHGIWHTQDLFFESFIALWKYPEAWPLSDVLGWFHLPLPGGYLLGALLFLNLIAAHFYRFKLSWKKSGILLVHSGLILLLVSELLTNLLAEESQMPVDEGGSKNYSVDYRANELVFIDRSPEGHNLVHAIPARALKSRDVVDVPDTPLRVRTLTYYPNSRVGRARKRAESRPANRGVAAKMGVVATPQEMDYTQNALNTASAYVQVLGPDGPLGTWLVSNVIDDRFPPQEVKRGDRAWEISLRFERTYYPFQVKLIDFSHDKYPGTDIPHNFSSEVEIEHENDAKDRKALIYMNHPLRYEGYTFYQSSFANQNRTSIFQVVRNPGWILPYISVTLMGLGLIVQFGMHFTRFLSKKKRSS